MYLIIKLSSAMIVESIKAVSFVISAIKMEAMKDTKLFSEMLPKDVVIVEIHKHGSLQDFVEITLDKLKISKLKNL